MTAVLDNSTAVLDTEARVLGIAFLSSSAMFAMDAELKLRASHFLSARHGLVWDAMRHLFEVHGEFDRTTVRAHMDRAGTLQNAGGDEALERLAAAPITAAGQVRQYVALIIDASRRRRLASIGMETIEATKGPDSTDDVLSALERATLELTTDSDSGGYTHIRDILDEEQERLHRLSTGEVQVTGLTTGYDALDEITGGFRGGQLIIVGARPSMGKSAFVTGIAEHVAIRGTGVALVSMEMGGGELAERLIAARTGVAADRLRKGQVRPDKWPGILNANAQLALAPLWIDDQSDQSIADIRARARRLAARNPVGLVIVDYLQLLRASAGADNRTAAVGEMSRGLKILARELDVPVIALSQLNRQVESRPDKRPTLADLRESGQIEQDADIVMFLYREEHYDADTERTGVADIIVAKHRGGRLDTVELDFDGPTMKFSNPRPRAEPAPAGAPF